MPMEDLIADLTVSRSRLDVSACRSFTRRFLLEDFYAEYDGNVDLRALDPSIVVIPFVANIIPIIWLSGSKDWR